MKFCENCGNVLVVKSSESSKVLFCKRCNKDFPLEDIVITFLNKDNKEIIILDESEGSDFPTTKILCPKCENMIEAYWAMQQTRAADEPPTRFYRCKECKHVWREYS